jgi:hypothetical protein
MFLYYIYIMVKKTIKLAKSNNLFTFENIIGVLLAILIVFDLKIEEPLCKLINTNMGIITSIFFVIILIVFVHPIVGILFLIYLYQCSNKTGVYSQQNKNNVLQELNPPQTLQVEEEVIYNKAPIKNQNQNNNVEFNSYSNNVGAPL